MAFKNKSPKNPMQPKVQPPPAAKPMKPMGGAPVRPNAPAAPVSAQPPGAAQVTGMARGMGNLALQKPWRPRRQQLLTPGMPQAGDYPQAIRTY